MNKQVQIAKYVISDVCSVIVSWTLFFSYRKLYIEPIKLGYSVSLNFDQNFYRALFLLPIFWVVLFGLGGSYIDLFRRSRLKELGQTLLIVVVGSLLLFFILLLDDFISNYHFYYYNLLALLLINALVFLIPRLIITTQTVKKIHSRKIGFNTLLIGSNAKALALYNEMQEQESSSGNLFIGYIHLDNFNGSNLSTHIPCLGNLDKLQEVINTNNVEEVIIAIESSEHNKLNEILNSLEGLNVVIKIIPDIYDILSGLVKMTSIFGAPLIQISRSLLTPWQYAIKRLIDVLVSLFALIILSPVYLIIAIMVKTSSKGSVFFKQERVGLYGKSFFIYKFRSMYIDAEKHGPALSSDSDKRITPVGKFLRKSRLDELPQFYNVLIGDMSLVGPRPERQFYIDQIILRAPHYKHLHKVRPGITSWGQVKYGYAENVDQMIDRLKFDILYIENMSLTLDIKIMIYTALIMMQGRGK